MMINYELYKVFYQVAVNASFSLAAKKLYISQSAVSQNIKKLEKELQTKLFNRQAKQIKLTETGQILFDHIEPAFNLIENGEKGIQAIQALSKGEIHLGVNDTIAKDFLLPYLNQFHRLYPEIQIQITNRTSSTCSKLLKQHKVDLIISNLPNQSLTNQLEVNIISQFNDIFIANQNFSKLKHKIIELNELPNYPLLLLEKKTTTRKFLDEFFRIKDIEIEAKIELGSVDLLIEMAKIGLGIAFVPEYAFNSYLSRINNANEKLFKLHLKNKLPARKLAVVKNKDVPVSNAVNAFLKLLLSG